MGTVGGASILGAAAGTLDMGVVGGASVLNTAASPLIMGTVGGASVVGTVGVELHLGSVGGTSRVSAADDLLALDSVGCESISSTDAGTSPWALSMAHSPWALLSIHSQWALSAAHLSTPDVEVCDLMLKIVTRNFVRKRAPSEIGRLRCMYTKVLALRARSEFTWGIQNMHWEEVWVSRSITLFLSVLGML
jgi:hypothetical protein